MVSVAGCGATLVGGCCLLHLTWAGTTLRVGACVCCSNASFVCFFIKHLSLGPVKERSGSFCRLVCQTSVSASVALVGDLSLFLPSLTRAGAYCSCLSSVVCYQTSVVMCYVKMRRCTLCAVVKLYQNWCVKIDRGGANASLPLVG